MAPDECQYVFWKKCIYIHGFVYIYIYIKNYKETILYNIIWWLYLRWVYNFFSVRVIFPTPKQLQRLTWFYARALQKVLRWPATSWAQSNEQVFMAAQVLDMGARLAVDSLLYAQRVFAVGIGWPIFLTECHSPGRGCGQRLMVCWFESWLALDAWDWLHCLASQLEWRKI